MIWVSFGLVDLKIPVHLKVCDYQHQNCDLAVIAQVYFNLIYVTVEVIDYSKVASSNVAILNVCAIYISIVITLNVYQVSLQVNLKYFS